MHMFQFFTLPLQLSLYNKSTDLCATADNKKYLVFVCQRWLIYFSKKSIRKQLDTIGLVCVCVCMCVKADEHERTRVDSRAHE